MHQLGNETDREEAKNKIKEILTARRRFYEAGITLLECDNTFAEKLKHTLETMTFTSKVVNIVGNGGGALPIDASIIRFYLEIDHRICVREENITINFEKHLCLIQLDDKYIAKIPIKNGIGIKNVINKSRI